MTNSFVDAKQNFESLPNEITLLDCLNEVKRKIKIGGWSRFIGKDKQNRNGKFEFWADRDGDVWFREGYSRPFPYLDKDLEIVKVKQSYYDFLRHGHLPSRQGRRKLKISLDPLE